MRSRPTARVWLTVAGAGAIAGAGACARMGAPPGGPEDRRPPVVIRTEPDTLVPEEGFEGPVRFHFDERISERVSGGALDDAVVVSPRTGEVRVSHGRQSISVELDGGFRPGLVYRVTLLPVVSDLFGNQLRDAFEIVFSTGAEVAEGALVGIAFDRITGMGVADLDVIALSDPDSTEYVAQADTGGIYAMRYLPPGRYRITAFTDRNRNGLVDPMEPQGMRSALIPAQDTLFVDIPVLQPDTMPARLARAQVLDSLTVALEFDKFLDPDVPSAAVSIGLTRDSTAEEGPVPAVERVYHEYEYVAFVDQVTDSLARLDSIRSAEAEVRRPPPDTSAASDSVAAGDTSAVAEPARPGAPPPLPTQAGQGRRAPAGLTVEDEGPPRAPDGSLLPARRLVVRLLDPLVPGVPYVVEVLGVTTITLMPQGGGTAAVLLEPPPPPDTAAVGDTAVADTTGVPPDTGGVALRLLGARR